MEGWIKLHRKIEKHWIWSNPLFIKAWVYVLFRANYKDNTILIGTKTRTAEVGTFYTSINNFGKATGLSFQQTRDFWSLLEENKMITKKGTKNGTKITVCNYVDYQVLEQDDNKIITRSQQDNNKGEESKEESKENKESKNPPKSPQGEIPDEGKKNEEHTPEKKEKSKSVKFPADFNYPKFRMVWFDEWIPYRKERKLVSSVSAQQRNMATLHRLSRGSTTLAIRIIRQSIDQNWNGLFSLKGYDGYTQGNAAKRGIHDKDPESITIKIDRNANK